MYQWSDPSDRYPPHLDTGVNGEKIPADQKNGAPGVGQIFDANELNFVGAIAQAFSFIIPDNIPDKHTPYAGPSLADCEKYNIDNPSTNTGIMDSKNLGNIGDWFSDARFAQQYLSGVNPCTIETAPSGKIQTYVNEAGKQGLEGMKRLLSAGKDLLIQDYSYFREATGVKFEQTFQNLIEDPTGNKTIRYACAPVVILQLHPDGRLHPLAITIDYRGSLDNSITIFNQRLTPDDKGIDEKNDWPWRYAKTCAGTADWARHEIATHLTDTHMIEEAIIVATNRTIPEDHLLYEILSPHWFRTLALNDAARRILVPLVIARIAGFGPSTEAKTSLAFNMVDWSYKNFNFQDKYIPNDLKKRGFDMEAKDGGEKYRNYPYATDMFLLWGVIRDFVMTVLEAKYRSDKDVQDDKDISNWCKEIQIKGQIPTFPTITTKDQLVDAVTMCIHIASPQHTAVNYLQEYYYGFVAARPPALCTPLPKDLQALKAYTEKDLTAALPIGTDSQKWKDWLLAAQLPKLLSYKVDSRYNLINYARSLYNVNKDRTPSENKEFYSKSIRDAAACFYDRLKVLEGTFETVSKNQTEGTVEYKVLQPELTAVSILI